MLTLGLFFAWSDFSESEHVYKDDPDTTSKGERVLRNLLILFYNSCANNPEHLEMVSNSSILQKVYECHRYIYCTEEYLKSGGEEPSAFFSDLCEWYTLLIGCFLKDPQGRAITPLYNQFISKKDRRLCEVAESSGLNYLKTAKNGTYLVTRD